MSRWVTKFESHIFHKSFLKLLEILNKIDISEITDNNALMEISRLKKVLEYMEKYIKLIEPDINILNIDSHLTQMNSYFTNTYNELNNFITNHNISYLHNANSHIDNALSSLHQLHTILPKVSGQGIFAMLKKYNETIDEALNEIDLASSIVKSNEIAKLKEKLLDGEDSISSKIEMMLNDMEEKHSELVNFYEELFTGINDEYSKKEEIEKSKEEIEEKLVEVKETIDEKVTEIENKLLNTSNKITKLDEFYIQIFGELNEEDERIGGLKKELEQRINTLDSFESEQQKKHNKILENKLEDIRVYEKEQQLHSKNLFEQIESLLPSATSAGLAKAYADERDNFKNPIRLWNIVFVTSLLVISFLSYQSMVDIENIKDLSKSLLHTLPITAPLIWLALYASKRRSENQRLEQEYAHKEALAKSYSSYKQQIMDLKQEDQVLLTKLLDSAIDTISDNASKTLDKKHGDKTPVQNLMKEGFDELKGLIKK